MDKCILIEQTLHGYSNGHHLLAASTQLSKTSQKTMLVLSDLSGNDIYPEFSEYLTGYPLPEDGYYALAKTWYAPEKERPGCVWTHTLLIHSSDIINISNYILLTKQFTKPRNDKDTTKYNEAISISSDSNIDNFNIIENNRFDLFNNIDISQIIYLIMSIYSKDQPILLPSRSSRDYEKISLLIWLIQWSGLRKNYAFCTGSLANRKYGEKIFDFQIVPKDIVKNISRIIDKPIILEEYPKIRLNSLISQLPFFIYDIIVDQLIKPNKKFREFLEDFGAKFENDGVLEAIEEGMNMEYQDAPDKNERSTAAIGMKNLTTLFFLISCLIYIFSS